jgi:hypothetical protein
VHTLGHLSPLPPAPPSAPNLSCFQAELEKKFIFKKLSNKQINIRCMRKTKTKIIEPNEKNGLKNCKG